MFLCLCLLTASCSKSPKYFRFDGFAQGGTWHVICAPPSARPGEIARISGGIDSIFRDVDLSISGYNRASLLSRFNQGETIVPDTHFRVLLDLSGQLCERTGGAFDPSAAPLFELWSFGFAQPSSSAPAIPSRAEIDSVLHFVGMHHFSLSGDGALLRDDTRCRLNFNAIAQGYTCDVIAGFLQESGCENFLVEVGGEIVCRGHNASGELWHVVCDAPDASRDTLLLTDCAIVTSGNYRKNFKADGEGYGHIIDPRSGMATSIRDSSRTVVVSYAESQWPAATADALATASMLR